MKKNSFIILIFVTLFAPILGISDRVFAQSELFCGGRATAEFAERAESHTYAIQMAPGDTLNVSVEPTGETLSTLIALYDPSGLLLYVSSESSSIIGTRRVSKSPSISSGILSARGSYTVFVTNTAISWPGSLVDVTLETGTGDQGGVGEYTLSITCTDKTGNVKQSGDNSVPELSEQPTNNLPEFSGFGFPGLPPVSFEKAIKLPLTLENTVPIEFSPEGEDILGLTVSAAKGEVLLLEYKKTSGNQNIGIAIISENSEVIFHVSLVSSTEFSTALTFPNDGKYTVGFFRIKNLMRTGSPLPTEFTISGSLNSDSKE